MASKNAAINKAKMAKEDEFYTQYEDVSRELVRYADQLRGKRVICPCDWDESLDEVLVYASEEEVAGSDLFDGGAVKIIDHAKVNGKVIADISEVKCNFIKFLVAHAEDYGIASIAVSGYDPETGKGVKFQDIDYSKYDVCVTNPPFSQIKEFIDLMFENDMEFLIIAPQTAIKYGNVFPHIMNNELWLGYHTGDMSFKVPDSYEERATRFWIDGSGQKWRSLGNIVWLTNMDVDIRHDRMILTEEYDSERYPKYVNYDAIEVPKIKDIPYDYDGLMGVPITFLQKYNPEQFEILGMNWSVLADAELSDDIRNNHDVARRLNFYLPIPDGKGNNYTRMYDRIVIRNREPYIED